MFKIHEDYYLRKQYLANNEVPSQTLIRHKMGESLSNLYFKNMSSESKVLAGLEPTLGQGCGDWYMPPKDVLKGRSVLKPVKKSCLSNLKYTGIDDLGIRMVHLLAKDDQLVKDRALNDISRYWKNVITKETEKHTRIVSSENANVNTSKIKDLAFQFDLMYIKSLHQIEDILLRATQDAVKHIREEAYNMLKKTYEIELKEQSTELYKKYDDILLKAQDECKNKCMTNISANRKKTMKTVHDVKVEKHRAVEKLRINLECQNLACQVYVAAMEKEECNRKLKEMQNDHRSHLKDLKTSLKFVDQHISKAENRKIKERKYKRKCRQELLLVVKQLQLFVSYCLKLTPKHAEFFINMERLMLLQLNECLSSPKTESLLYEEQAQNTPTPKKCDPYIIFGDMKMHATNVTSDIPMFVVNKNCIYAVCENVKDLTDKLQHFIQEDETTEEKDDYDYSRSLPLKYASVYKAKELNLESSLMKIIQNEIRDLENMFNSCDHCKMDICLCSPPRASAISFKIIKDTTQIKLSSQAHETCKCQTSTIKKQIEYLPPYMLQTSIYQPIDINYEPCSQVYLHRLHASNCSVKELKTREIGTQFGDRDVDVLMYACCCDNDSTRVCTQTVDGHDIKSIERRSNTYLSSQTFAMERAHELKRLISSSESVEIIYRRDDKKRRV